jgi:1-acyl-sn-glycerol-3-phosphate acyltransferase
MLEALTHPMLTPLVQTYLLSTVRGHFADVRVHLEQPVLPMPTIFFATHQSWWDGHLILALTQLLKLEFRVLMLEENLSKYGFLRYAGAFGVNRNSVASVRGVLRYSRAQLEAGIPRAVLMFPSGEITSPFARPMVFESGLASLVSICTKAGIPVQVRALAMRLEHGLQTRPSAFIRLGAACEVSAGSISSLSALLAYDLTVQADCLHQDLLQNNLKSYEPILRGLPSAQEGWDVLRRKLGIQV